VFKDRIADIDKIKCEIDQYRPLSSYLLSLLKECFRIGLTYYLRNGIRKFQGVFTFDKSAL